MKKRTTLAAVLLAVLFGMTAFAAPLTETVESGAEVSDMSAAAHTTESKNATLNAGEIPSPGINILTGTSEAETFEDYEVGENGLDYVANGGYTPGFNNTAVASAIVAKDAAGNQSLTITPVAKSYPYFRWKLSGTIEAGRPIYVSTSVKKTGSVNFWFVGLKHATASNNTENLVYNPGSMTWLSGTN